MYITDIPAAIEEFEKEHGNIEPLLEPRLIGFSWAIGIQGGNVVLVRNYPLLTQNLYEFSLMRIQYFKEYTLRSIIMTKAIKTVKIKVDNPLPLPGSSETK